VTPSQPTLAALLTPPGTAALAVVAIRGPRAWPVISSRFEPLAARDWPPERIQAGQFWLGHFRASERGLVDHVIVAVDRADDQTWLEVHCHGGREVVRWICEILEGEGIATVSWQDLKADTQSRTTNIEASLARAPTIRTASILLDQAQGAMAREVAKILNNWPSEEGSQTLTAMASRIDLGLHLAEPWKIAVLGAPNVGKSALVNALAGYTRSIVCEVPGTTRDLLSVRLAIDGWPVELWDTAGMREGLSSLEQEGIQRAREMGAGADICLWVLDSSAPPVWPDFAHRRMRFVINKIDMSSVWPFQRDALVARIGPTSLDPPTLWHGVPTVPLPVPTVSAKTGERVPELCQAISGWLVPDPPPAGAAVPCTSVVAERIRSAHRLFEQRQLDDARLELLSVLNAEQKSLEHKDLDGT
jgi:tRNA modification GTPase